MVMTLEQIKDDIAKEHGYQNYAHFWATGMPDEDITDEIARRYGDQIAITEYARGMSAKEYDTIS